MWYPKAGVPAVAVTRGGIDERPQTIAAGRKAALLSDSEIAIITGRATGYSSGPGSNLEGM
jgi:hypothetical protein